MSQSDCYITVGGAIMIISLSWPIIHDPTVGAHGSLYLSHTSLICFVYRVNLVNNNIPQLRSHWSLLILL